MHRSSRLYVCSQIFRVLATEKTAFRDRQHAWKRKFSVNCARLNLYENVKDNLESPQRCSENTSSLRPGCLTVNTPRWTSPLRMSSQWLRDHCQCPQCKDPVTGLRRALYLQTKVEIDKAKFDNDVLTLTWTDGHESAFHHEWLWKHNAAGQPKNPGLPEKTIWNAEKAKTIDFAKLQYEDFIHSEDSVRTFLKSILNYGIAIVQNVPVTSEHTRKVMERNGPIWRTFWGEIYHVVADLTQHTHPSYTGADLAYHTDTNYYFEGAGLQAFHVLEHTGEGANNKFVDGFCVANAIKTNNPEVYDFLSNNTVSFKYRETGKLHLKNEDVLFKHHPTTKELVQLRFTPYDFDVFRTPKTDQTDLFYHSLHTLAAEIKNIENTHWIQLRPGTVLVTDNWRVLHGRTPFTGRRTLCGMYVSRSDFLSRARRFGLID